MRLIDADAFIADLGNGKGIAIRNIRKMAEDYPTAYDVDKVVKQIEEKILNTSDTQIGISARMAYGKAIEIVKFGGVIG